jgi:hypothetical protein
LGPLRHRCLCATAGCPATWIAFEELDDELSILKDDERSG